MIVLNMEKLSRIGDSNISRSSESNGIPSVAVSVNQEFEYDIDSLSTAELKNLLEQITIANLKLANENELMEDAVKEAEQFQGPIVSDEKGGPLHKASSRQSASADSVGSLLGISENDSGIHPSARWKSRSRSGLVESHPVLSVQHRCYIASKKLKVLQSILENLEQSKYFKLDVLKSKLEEIDIETTAVEAAKYEFNQSIRIKGRHPVTKKVMGEKVKTYFKNSLRKMLILTERMRMQASHCKMLRKKIILEMEEKRDLSVNLHEIDFIKIKIEHKRCSEMLKEYNRKFLQLKARSNRSVQVLIDFKKELDKEIVQLNSTKEQNIYNKRLLTIFEFAECTYNQQKKRLETAKQKVLNNPKKKHVPDVMDYVYLEADLQKREKAVHSWKSKVAVAEQAKFLYYSSKGFLEVGMK